MKGSKPAGSNPHDALFKRTFSQVEHAAGLLRAVLPAEVVPRIDWATLEQVPGSFVDARLAQRHSDLLFSARLVGGGTALLYVLVEHQSEPDPWMALRMYGYVDRIWQRWRGEHAEAERLPAVVPVVVHHGRGPWTAARALGDLYDLDDETRRALRSPVPELAFVLDDLGRIATPALEARPMTDLGRLVLLCLQRARVSADMVADLERWLDMLRHVLAGPTGRDAIATVLRYVLRVSDAEPERLLAMLEAGIGSEATEAFMTGAEKLIEKGRAEVLLRQLALRFGTIDAATVARVRAARPEELDRWVDRVLTAASLDELFAP